MLLRTLELDLTGGAGAPFFLVALSVESGLISVSAVLGVRDPDVADALEPCEAFLESVMICSTMSSQCSAKIPVLAYVLSVKNGMIVIWFLFAMDICRPNISAYRKSFGHSPERDA